jgi:hypothetical protein
MESRMIHATMCVTTNNLVELLRAHWKLGLQEV